MKRVLFALLTLASTSAFSQSVPKSFTLHGEELLYNCKFAAQYYDDASISQTEYALAHNCIGVVHGVGDTLQYLNVISIPEDTSSDEPVRVVIKYLQDHPEELKDRDTLVVLKALKKRFPRKPTKSQSN